MYFCSWKSCNTNFQFNQRWISFHFQFMHINPRKQGRRLIQISISKVIVRTYRYTRIGRDMNHDALMYMYRPHSKLQTWISGCHRTKEQPYGKGKYQTTAVRDSHLGQACYHGIQLSKCPTSVAVFNGPRYICSPHNHFTSDHNLKNKRRNL